METLTAAEYRALVAKKRQPTNKRKGSKAKAEIEMMLKLFGKPYETEFKFHPKRKWRFDFCIPELKIAIEYEGLMSEKSRHTTITGFTNDSEKYNAAQILGWRVLRYTALNYKSLSEDLNNLLQSSFNPPTQEL